MLMNVFLPWITAMHKRRASIMWVVSPALANLDLKAMEHYVMVIKMHAKFVGVCP